MSDALQKLSRLVRYQKVVETVLPRLPKPLRKALRRFHFGRAIRRSLRGPTPPVLVYATPKVASTAVTHALMSVEGQTVFHVHMISAANIRRLREGMQRRGLTRARQDMKGIEDLGLALAEEINRDPRYFPDPERFDPERFTPEARAAWPAFSYFPFDGGPRRCLGESFALMEGVLLLATLARRWRLRLVPGHPVEVFPEHLLRSKHGMMMRAEKRRNDECGMMNDECTAI